MGDVFAAAAVQLRAAADGREPRTVVAPGARTTADRRTLERQARSAGHLCRGRAAGSSLSDAGSVDLAAARRDRDVGPVRLVDLLRDRGRVGIDPAVRHARRLVLADERQESARARRPAPPHAPGERVMTPLRQGYGGQAANLALDVSDIPDYGFGHHNMLWWATASMMVIEGMVFAMVITSYVYLKGRSPYWPPTGPSPRLLWGTVNTLILLASAVPNALTKKAAQKFDLARVKLWLAVCLAFAVAFNIVRFLEFGALNVRWDQNAYGSVVWVLVGFHTLHVLTDLPGS